MRISRGTVVDGRIVIEGEPLREGARVTVLLADEPGFSLSSDDEAALLVALGEADRGELLDSSEVLKRIS